MKPQNKPLLATACLLLAMGCSAHEVNNSSSINSIKTQKPDSVPDSVQATNTANTEKYQDSSQEKSQDNAQSAVLVRLVNKMNKTLLLADDDNTKAKANGDYLVSGLGVVGLLQAIAEGAVDASYQQIADYLATDDKLNDKLNGNINLADLKLKQDNNLQSADTLLITEQATIEQDYLQQLSAAGFGIATDLQDLNAQVAEQTHGAIPQALQQLPPNARLVLNNSLHFKAPWATPFAENQTKTATFHALCDGKISPKPLPFMSQKVTVRRYLDDKNKMLGLSLPFQGDYTMLLAMSTQTADRQSANSAKQAAEWLLQSPSNSKSNMHHIFTASPTSINLRLPKMQLTAANDLRPALQAVGINDIFDETLAKLPKISAKTDLFVQQFSQQTKFTADESGAQAAAVTTAVLSTRSLKIIDTLTIDKPFAFAIMQKSSGLIVMSGKIQQLNACQANDNQATPQEKQQ